MSVTTLLMKENDRLKTASIKDQEQVRVKLFEVLQILTRRKVIS